MYQEKENNKAWKGPLKKFEPFLLGLKGHEREPGKLCAGGGQQREAGFRTGNPRQEAAATF